ncbi:TPA_asm: UL36.5 [Human alphaherpesvirus 1]|nr:TPA_asm: UL36.5 [Human alphaherpesvirus 1]
MGPGPRPPRRIPPTGPPGCQSSSPRPPLAPPRPAAGRSGRRVGPRAPRAPPRPRPARRSWRPGRPGTWREGARSPAGLAAPTQCWWCPAGREAARMPREIPRAISRPPRERGRSDPIPRPTPPRPPRETSAGPRRGDGCRRAPAGARPVASGGPGRRRWPRLAGASQRYAGHVPTRRPPARRARAPSPSGPPEFRPDPRSPPPSAPGPASWPRSPGRRPPSAGSSDWPDPRPRAGPGARARPAPPAAPP